VTPGLQIEMRVIRVAHRQSSGEPGLHAADQIGDLSKTEAAQICSRKRRAIATVADDDDRLIERHEGRVQIPVRRVEMPLDHSSRYVYRAGDHAESRSIGIGSGVEHQRRVSCLELRMELDGCDSINQRAGLVHQVVHGEPRSAPQQRGGRVATVKLVDANEVDFVGCGKRQLVFGRANEGEVTVSLEMQDGSVQKRSVRTSIDQPGRRQYDHVVSAVELRCRGQGPVTQRVDGG
jgi:hypothetical protein